MRSRLIAGCAVAALAMGMQATEAGAAKPALWVLNFARERLTPPVATSVRLEVDRACQAFQEAQLSTNGKPSDTVTPASTVTEFCGGEKTAGRITSIALKPAGGLAMTITAKDSFLVDYAEEWCAYALPKSFSLPASARSFGEVTLTGALDKAASFGSCPKTRAIQVSLRIEQNEYGELYEAETVG